MGLLISVHTPPLRFTLSDAGQLWRLKDILKLLSQKSRYCKKKMLRGLFQGFFFMAVNMSFYLTSDSTLCCNCTIYKCGHWRLNPRRTPSGWTYFLWWSNICGQCVSNTSASVKYPNMCVCNICLLSAKHLPYSMCIGLMSVKVVKSVWRLLYIRIHWSWSLCVLKYWVQTYGDTHMGLHL